MKLQVDKVRFSDRYAVFTHSFLWGWERYDNLSFATYKEAVEHAKMIKELDK